LSSRIIFCAIAVCLFLHATADAAELSELRIGYQKSSVNFLVARQLGLCERRFPGVRVRWVEFAAGPQLLEALGAGSLDVGTTGDTPPIFAQAAGRDMLYVGQESSKPQSSAILVQEGSHVDSLSALRGKRIAFQKGSSSHYLLLRALEKGGLKLGDVEPIYLGPADARAAFERHSVDAWAIWDPYWAAAAAAGGVRVLTTGEGLADDVTFYEASRSLTKEHPTVIRDLLASLNEADQYIRGHPADAARLVANATGLDVAIATVFLKRRGDSPVNLPNPRAIASQQAIADAFADAGIIPRINVNAVVWDVAPAPGPDIRH
jgi:sulfonate transport system substrate-binding protein